MKPVMVLAILLLGLGGGGFIWWQRGLLMPEGTMADATPEERAAVLSSAISPPAPAEVPRPAAEGSVSPAPPTPSEGGLAFVINSAEASIDLIDVGTRKLVR